MHSFPSVNIFKIQLPVNEYAVVILLHLFCGKPGRNSNKKYTYSIVGKILGLRNAEARADIISDYGFGNQLKDNLVIERNQFIFSNQSMVPARFNIKMKLKGILPVNCVLTAHINIEMKYTLNQIFVNSISSRYAVKNIREPSLLLMQ